MSTPQEPQSIRDLIEQKIQEGRVAMRPRWHFVLRAVLAVLGVLLVLLVGLYLVSFVVFVARTTDIGFLPEFGLRGVGYFLYSLPWVVIGIAFVFVIVLEVLVRRYAFAYRRPLLYTVVGGLMFVALGGAALAYYTPIHGPSHRLPIAQPVYRHYESLPVREVKRGRVVEMHDGEPEIRMVAPSVRPDVRASEEREGKRVRVRTNKATKKAQGRELRVGDDVMIFGEDDGDDIRAFGIRRLNGDRD